MIFRLTNQTRQILLADRALLADTAWSRMRGLLGRDTLVPGEALVITGCQSIHMVFMKFAIDVVFVDRKGVVVGLVQNISPFSLSPIFWRADRAIELPAGVIASSGTSLSDQIIFSS